MLRKNNLLFLTDTLTSYQYDFFDKLYKYFDLRVIVLNKKKYKNYNFKFPKKKYTIFLEEKLNNRDKIKKIIKIYNPSRIIFCGYRIKYSFLIKKLIKSKKVKFYYWLERINKEEKLKLYLISKVLKRILKDADGIFAIGKEALRFYKKFNLNVIDLPYAIKIKKKIKKKKSRKLNFLFAGQLIKRKGVDILINTLKKIKIKNLKHCNFTVVEMEIIKMKLLNSKDFFLI